MESIKGIDNLVKTLDTLKGKTTKKAAKAGVNAGLQVLSQFMRSAINASSASPQMKAAARKTIAKRLKKKEGQDYVGKAGFAVGKQSKAKQGAAVKRSMDKSKRGVGISSNDIHWPVLGTMERVSTKGSTGRMPAVLSGIINSAVASAGSAMLEAARKKVTEVLARDAAKAKKG